LSQSQKPDDKPLAWYQERYPYAGDWGKVFNQEMEFEWPEGYKRIDSSKLTPFQHWISFMPLWPYSKGVGSLKRGEVLSPDKISRVVRLPWRTSQLIDYVIPIQIAAEYLLWQKRPQALILAPAAGDTLSYSRWLTSMHTYGPRGDVHFTESTPRLDSKEEFNRYIDLCAHNFNYAALAKNSDSISGKNLEKELAPGDLLIGHNETGLKGKTVILLNVIVNKKKGKLYLVGLGCEFGCDLHIPLNGDNRRNPWLTLAQVKALLGEWPQSGFYRLKIE